MDQWLSNLCVASESPEGVVETNLKKQEFQGPSTRVTHLIGSRWDLRMCIYNKFSGDSDLVPVEKGILKWPYLTRAEIQ